jgi:hypothetical protein
MPELTEQQQQQQFASEVESKQRNVDGTEHNLPHKGSGLLANLRAMGYIPDEELEETPSVEIDTQLTGIPEVEKEKFLKFYKENPTFNDEEFKKLELSEEIYNKIKNNLPDYFTEPTTKDDFSGKPLEELDKPLLIEEIKKNQRFVSERQKQIEELGSQIKELEAKISAGTANPELEEFVQGLTKDFKGTYDKYKDKYKLPSIDVVQKQYKLGDTTSRVQQWQESSLRNQIEQEFNLAEGEFEFDATDAAKAGTASYRWTELTDLKKQELLNEQRKLQSDEQERLSRLEEQQKIDKQQFATKFLNGDTSAVEGLIAGLNETSSKVALGELPSEKHPFSMYNLLLAFKHEDIVKSEVQKAIDDTIKQFGKYNLYLPNNEENTPTDASKVKAKPANAEVFNSEALTKSPMLRSMYDYLQQ